MRRALAVALALATSGCALFLPRPDGPEQLAEWEHTTVSLRQLEFQRPVGFEWLSRDELPEVLKYEADQDLEPLRVTRQRDSLAALGAMAPDVDLGKELLDIYVSQVSGLYSLKRNTLYVLDEMAGALKRPMLDSIVVHELTHALQDQNFPQLLELMVALDREDDLTSAFSGVIEGDATVTMFGALPVAARKPNDPTTVMLAERMRDEMLGELDDSSGDVGRAPRLLALGLVFPYAYGTVTAAQHWAARGNAGLDAELVDPPLATLHLIYPETRGPVEFVRLPLERLGASQSTPSCELDSDNVAGALVLRVLFEKGRSPDALRALLTGWRGDRYVRLDCGATWELVWLTRWKSVAAAQRFAEAYRALAPEIAARTRLSGPAEVVVRGRTALAVTPGLRARADELLRSAEVRAFSDLGSWIAAGCFPEDGCPKREPTQVATPGRE